jgi:TonB family protein
MTTLVLAIWLVNGLAVQSPDVPSVSLSDLDAVKAAYTAANYDEVLQRVQSLDPDRVTVPIERYRALSLIAFGRAGEASQAFERLVRRAPEFRMTDADVAPRVASMFHEVRGRLLPGLIRERYAHGKSSYDQRQFSDAATELEDVVALLDDPDMDAQRASMDELRQLAEGFLRLARAETDLAARVLTPSPTLPATAVGGPPLPRPDPDAAIVTRIVIYSAADTGVTPPVEIERRMPPWSPPATMARAEFRGAVEIVVNEIGAVESAVMATPTVPPYDLTLLEAARRWRFKPAVLKDQPVKYRLTYNVVLGPRR